MPPVGKAVDNPGVPVKREYHGLVASEDFVEIPVFKSVRMFRLRLKRHQINHVDDADANVRHLLAQQCHRCEDLERGHVAVLFADDPKFLAMGVVSERLDHVGSSIRTW
jgi:hypothetical protein